MPLPRITHQEFDKVQDIKYGFFTKHGGVSTGIHSSLNFAYGKGDIDENIKVNKQIISQEFELETPEYFIFPHQIHSNKVFILENFNDLRLFHNKDFTQKPNVDAIVTRQKGVLIGVKSADCVPVLFVDDKNQVIGSAHSGWKGARFDILENTVKAMIKLGAEPENIKVIIGPCIKQDFYEVSDGFMKENFLVESKLNSKFFKLSKNPNKFMFDITGYVRTKLKSAGLRQNNIFDVNIDTYSNAKNLFSYRRNCHQGYVDTYGAQISVIMLY